MEENVSGFYVFLFLCVFILLWGPYPAGHAAKREKEWKKMFQVFIFMCIYFSVYLFFCLFIVFLSIYFYVYLFLCLFIFMSIYFYVRRV